MYRQALFAIEDGPAFVGYTDGRTWNGFDCPLFNYDTAMRIAAWIGDHFGDTWEYTESDDTLRIWSAGCSDDDPDAWTGRDVTIGDTTTHVYDVGSGNWIWSEVEPDTIAEAIARTYHNDWLTVERFYTAAEKLRGSCALVDAILDAVDAWLIAQTMTRQSPTVDEALTWESEL